MIKTQVYETASSIEERLERIAGEIAPLDRSLFKPVKYKELGVEREVWLHPYPLRAADEIVIDKRSFTRKDKKMALVNLDLSEQQRVYELVSDILGLKITFPSLSLSLEAAYNPETKEYKENVQVPFWTYNGILSKKEGDKTDVRRVIGVKFVDEYVTNPTRQIMQDIEGKEFPTQQLSEGRILRRRYIVDPPFSQPPLQTELPTKSGSFDNFRKVAPVDADLVKAKGRACWWGTNLDNENFSAVGSEWVSDVQWLFAGSYRPLVRNDFGALGVCTPENPKK